MDLEQFAATYSSGSALSPTGGEHAIGGCVSGSSETTATSTIGHGPGLRRCLTAGPQQLHGLFGLQRSRSSASFQALPTKLQQSRDQLPPPRSACAAAPCGFSTSPSTTQFRTQRLRASLGPLIAAASVALIVPDDDDTSAMSAGGSDTEEVHERGTGSGGLGDSGRAPTAAPNGGCASLLGRRGGHDCHHLPLATSGSLTVCASSRVFNISTNNHTNDSVTTGKWSSSRSSFAVDGAAGNGDFLLPFTSPPPPLLPPTRPQTARKEETTTMVTSLCATSSTSAGGSERAVGPDGSRGSTCAHFCEEKEAEDDQGRTSGGCARAAAWVEGDCTHRNESSSEHHSAGVSGIEEPRQPVRIARPAKSTRSNSGHHPSPILPPLPLMHSTVGGLSAVPSPSVQPNSEVITVASQRSRQDAAGEQAWPLSMAAHVGLSARCEHSAAALVTTLRGSLSPPRGNRSSVNQAAATPTPARRGAGASPCASAPGARSRLESCETGWSPQRVFVESILYVPQDTAIDPIPSGEGKACSSGEVGHSPPHASVYHCSMQHAMGAKMVAFGRKETVGTRGEGAATNTWRQLLRLLRSVLSAALVPATPAVTSL